MPFLPPGNLSSNGHLRISELTCNTPLVLLRFLQPLFSISLKAFPGIVEQCETERPAIRATERGAVAIDCFLGCGKRGD